MLGGLFGGGGSNETTSQVVPWRGSRDILTHHLRQLYKADPWELYEGPQQAELNEYQQRQFGDAESYMDEYGGFGGDLMRQGQGLADRGLGGAEGYYSSALGQGPVQMQDTQGILDNAAQFADNPYLSGQIDAAAQDVTRNLYENQMPGIAAYSAGTGNLGSSRRGMLEGMAQRAAGDRIGNIAAGMRGQAYGQGLNYANQIAQQNAQLNMSNRANQMNAANQLAGLGNTGLGMQNQGQGMFNYGQQLMGNVGQQLFNYDQTGLDIAKNQHYLAQQLPYMQAGQGVNIAMGPGTAFGTGTQTAPGGGNGMMGMLGMGANLLGGYMGMGGFG